MGEPNLGDQHAHERRVGFVFLRPRSYLQLRRMEPRTYLTWSPRLHLGLLESIVERYGRIVRQLEHRDVERRIEMVTSLMQRNTRVETRHILHHATNAPPGESRWIEPPATGEQIVLRQAPRVMERGEPPRPLPNAPAGIMQAPFDPVQLAERVMRSIDRRLEVHRERVAALRAGKERQR